MGEEEKEEVEEEEKETGKAKEEEERRRGRRGVFDTWSDNLPPSPNYLLLPSESDQAEHT